jgi:hypothetical protein
MLIESKCLNAFIKRPFQSRDCADVGERDTPSGAGEQIVFPTSSGLKRSYDGGEVFDATTRMRAGGNESVKVKRTILINMTAPGFAVRLV